MTKEYGFRLLDKTTHAVVQDWRWYPYWDSREKFIRQYTSDHEHAIQRGERNASPLVNSQLPSPR